MFLPQAIFLLPLLLLVTQSSSVTFTATPLTLTKSNSTVKLQWTQLSSLSPLDFLAIYSPPSSLDPNFIGYVFLNSSINNTITLPLAPLRSPYSFRLFRWSPEEINPKHHDHDQNPLPSTKHRLAVTAEVSFVDDSVPDQVHLAFTEREDEMRVMFVAGAKGERVVRYGREEGALEMEAAAEVRRYEVTDMCDFPANSSLGWRDPGFVFDAVMKGLEKGKRYFYKVGSDSGGWSKIHSFISRDNESNETIAFLFGDMGTYTPYRTFYRIQEESILTVKWILRDIEALGEKPAFVSHIGDISYARGFAWIWDEFFNQIEPIASQVPYHVCIGNHEYDWPTQPWKPEWSSGVYGKDGGGECGVPYSVKFKMPGNSSFPTGTGSPDTTNLYYSFGAGVVHFLYISTETDFLPGSDQYNFIKTDLESVDRNKTPFVVVQGHRPMYTTSDETRDAPLTERMREHLEPLFVQNNVTLALWGHVHRYERFCPMNNFTCTELSSNFTFGSAPVHVVIGMGGQDWQSTWAPRPEHADMPIFPQPERSMYRTGEFGYTRLFANRERLRLEYVGNHDGQVHDILEILSGHKVESSGSPEIPDKVFDKDAVDKVLDKDVDEKVFDKDAVMEPSLPWYVKAAGIMMLGVFLGYALGFITRWRRDSLEQAKWAPVKSEEI